MARAGKKGDGRITFEEFSAAVKLNGYPEPSHATFWTFLNSARNYSIFDKQELAMVLAHMIHESDGFIQRREEVDMVNYPPEYKDEECDIPGQLYYGRGYLKLTHCRNYRHASQDVFGDDRLVNDPELVAHDEEVAITTAFTHWNRQVHDLPGVSEGQFGVTTNALRGTSECSGTNTQGARKRFEIYKEVRKAFKLKGDEDERGCYELNEFATASEGYK